LRNFDIGVTRIDGEGGKVWERSYGTEAEDYANRTIRSLDGGFVVVGTTRGPALGDGDVYIFKVDDEGNRIWERSYGDPYGSEAGWDIVEVSRDCYVVAGSAHSSDDRDYLYLVKTCPVAEPISEDALCGIWVVWILPALCPVGHRQGAKVLVVS